MKEEDRETISKENWSKSIFVPTMWRFLVMSHASNYPQSYSNSIKSLGIFLPNFLEDKKTANLRSIDWKLI